MYGPICSQCGQKIALPFETSKVAKDIWSHFLELDFKFARASKEIITRPGLMIKDYLSGKRILYTNPFKFLFFTATAYFLVISYFDINVGGYGSNAKEMGKMVAALLNYLIFFFLILTSLFFKLIYARKSLNFAESYVAVCYLWSGYLLVGIAFAMIVRLTSIDYTIARTILGVLYVIYATKSLFDLSMITAIWKAIVFFACYILSTFIVMTILIAFSYFVGFEPLMISLNGK